MFPGAGVAPKYSGARCIIQWKGLDIGLEYQPGDLRHGRPMQVSYGHVRNYVGADKEALDVYLGVKPISDRVFQIDQTKPDGSFDEHKFMLWFDNQEEAKRAYLNQMPSRYFGKITEVKLQALEQYKKK